MAYISGFSDNQLIGVDDLNAITKRLVTSGVGDVLKDSSNLTVSQLNGITAIMIDGGIVPDNPTCLRVSKSGSTIGIEPGTAFFADGSFIEVTSKEKISFSKADGYVYLLNDTALGEKTIKVTESEPSGDFILLAEISDGVVLDKRTYAKGKVPSYSSFSGYPLKVKKVVTCVGESRYDRRGSFTLDLGNYFLNGILLVGDEHTGVAVFDENKKVTKYVCGSDDRTLYRSYLMLHRESDSTFAYVKFSCTSEGLLTVDVFSSVDKNYGVDSWDENVEFMIF